MHSHAVIPISLRFVLLECLGDETSDLKFASILSVAFPIHMHRLQEPRAKMPLYSVTNKPGAVKRCTRMLIKGLMKNKKQTNLLLCLQELLQPGN